ncbi:SAM-dependent methyltransferase [Acinetobacter gerneri]|jgi:SAM-dependent methyltransferase|uniref:SAM-dependent methyltransferase n=1 Tax=Acinetobacter gerneri TaxID=202952 RepID=UPI0023F4975A|nr:class I SAM-dependent methyltransferase [Acinetobacter gerneri]MCH4244989.1 class I SAM-dependent methyltransferase [Acinetobacter gerneri]
MKWLQAIKQQLPKHKYAINAKLLGDDGLLAWSNLGLWSDTTLQKSNAYVQACQALAKQLADSIQLNSQDRVLDLGCGQGASLNFFKQYYALKQLSGVELQDECVKKIKHNMPQSVDVYCESFLNLADIPFTEKFDAVLCIDAAYHSNLHHFLDNLQTVLTNDGRVAFHFLIFSEKWRYLSTVQKEKYRLLLKGADVDALHIYSKTRTEEILRQHHFKDIEIEDLSEEVFLGFSKYIALKKQSGAWTSTQQNFLDILKITMTAKLCHKLYQDGVVRYVKITAKNAKA